MKKKKLNSILAEKTDAIFVVPDMHLHLKGSSDFFQDNEKKFLSFLRYLKRIKSKYNRVVFIQLGDMFELWTEPVSYKKIYKRYKDLIDKMNSLDFKYIYGNHDYSLSLKSQRKKHGLKKRVFSKKIGRIYFEHGYIPDVTAGRKFWFFAHSVVTVTRFFQRLYHLIRHKITGNKLKKPGEEPWLFVFLKHKFNRLRNKKYYAQYKKDYEQRIEFYLNRIKEMKKNKIRLVVLCHTHESVLHKENGYYYLDCGSWTGNNTNFALITKNEIALCKYI